MRVLRHSTWMLGGLVLGAFIIGSVPANTAAPNVTELTALVNELGDQVATLNDQVAALREREAALLRDAGTLDTTVANQAASTGMSSNPNGPDPGDLNGLRSLVASHDAKLQFVSVEGTEMYITGANVNIRDGSGATSGTVGQPITANPTGLGNLVIGYNENISNIFLRTGSHNLVVGPYQSYSSVGGVVAGYGNTISSVYASVTGGYFNTAGGNFASVSGGASSTANGMAASISGGNESTASGVIASVSGGAHNTASGRFASITGGEFNTASGIYTSVTGGETNVASGHAASITGGYLNNATFEAATVTGGAYNTASGRAASVGGGVGGIASLDFSWTAGILRIP